MQVIADRLFGMAERFIKSRFDLNDFGRWAKRWRIIQLAALLPILLSVFFIFYFKEASGVGIVMIFLVLIVGVLLPEVKADIAQSNLIIRLEFQELQKEMQGIRKELQGLSGQKLKEAQQRPTTPTK
jgi:membrane protein insertase Oxa1/YidC/SpoIIIJ